MKKKKVHVFGHDAYLLGQGTDGVNYYLVQESWDCGWYWGLGYVLGYVQSFTNNSRPERSRDISSHSHFDCMFLKGNAWNTFHEFFRETVLTDKEIWTLLELMRSAYTLRDTADLFFRGGTHYTSNPCKEVLHSQERADEINQKLIPAVMTEVRKLLIG